MWKYVSRRIRDVCDRTYNVLDVRRPFQRGGERFCAEGGNFTDEGKSNKADGKGPSYCLLNVVAQRKSGLGWAHRNATGSSGSEGGGEGFRRNECCPPEHSWVGAITWTSAIICGWYTSQLICLYRRNNKWEGPKCLPFLITSAHNLPRDFRGTDFSKCFLKSGAETPSEQQNQRPEQGVNQHQQQQVTFFGVPIPTAKLSQLGEFDFERFSEVVRVVNHEERAQGKKADYGVQVVNDQPVEPKSPTVESAMENLVAVIGEIEYQLGVQNLEVGDYATAVSHLKLGTSHQHAGAAFNLGICFEQGFGVKKNARVAMECFHLASTLGHAQAMYNLGVYYARGLGGLRRSRSMAKKYFTAAADLGLKQAVVALGPSYRTRRESMGSASGSSSSSSSLSPTFAVPFEFKLNYDDLEQYGFGAGIYGRGAEESPMEQHPEMRLVSAMA